jgi:hypothetical protein
VHRSRRRWYERPLALVGIRAYRCYDCNYRFPGLRQRADDAPRKKAA